MTMKKKILTTLSVVLILGLAALGILAYLSDTDSDVNVMTLGNVDIEQIEEDANGNPFEQKQDLYPNTKIDKVVTVKNVGDSAAYVRTLIAFEVIDSKTFRYTSNLTSSKIATITKDGVKYDVYEYVYPEKLAKGEETAASLTYVKLDADCTNEDMEKLGGTYEVLVFSQAIQAEGFGSASEAFAASGFTTNPWEGMVIVDTAAELSAAIANGGEIALVDNVAVDANTAITVPAGKNVVLDLNGFTVKATANKSGNQEAFLVKGNMTVKDGDMEITAENNQGWNAMATIFDVTAGGVLNLEDVKAKASGTDMNFIVHLNNWGEATLNVNNCDFTATYCAVRAFNSGYDMNNVTIKNTDFHNGRAFWVHNYTSEGKDDSTLNLDIYNNNNTTDNAKPVRFGFSDSTYYDINGNLIP